MSNIKNINHNNINNNIKINNININNNISNVNKKINYIINIFIIITIDINNNNM